MTYLVDPVVKTELGPWQRSFIIKTLLAQGKNVEVYIVQNYLVFNSLTYFFNNCFFRRITESLVLDEGHVSHCAELR